jgi:peptidoglycan/LPS O-acetylase OafA/YrhL
MADVVAFRSKCGKPNDAAWAVRYKGCAIVDAQPLLSLNMREEVQPIEHVSTETVRTQPKKRSGYIASLDGWRCVAILWVLLGHIRIISVGGVSDAWIKATDYRGVQLFFALSGFLICSRLLREEKRFGSISIRSFYTRRLFRIQPAAMTYLSVVALLSLAGLIPRFWPGILGAALMVRNIWPTQLVPGYLYTVHFWSLAVEEHFYLLLPTFLLLVRRNRLVILSLAGVLLEIWHQVVLATPRLQHGLGWQVAQRTDMVLGGILLGSLFSVALTHDRLMKMAKVWLRPWVALLYTAFIFVELERHHSSWAQMAIITVYPVLITSTVLNPNSLLGRLLELPPVRFVGRISYSLYLWQEICLNNLPRLPALHPIYSNLFLCWCAAFACAIASYYLIETPLIRQGHKIAKRFDLQPMRSPSGGTDHASYEAQKFGAA